jgi:signal transduction histidine kinase
MKDDLDRDLRFLLAASEKLAASLSLEEILEDVAQLLVPERADGVVVCLSQPGGAIEPVLVRHVAPATAEAMAGYFRRFPLTLDDSGGLVRVMASGVSYHVAEVDAEGRRIDAVTPERRAYIAGMGLRSTLTVPLRSPREIIGALSLVTSSSGRRLEARDMVFAEELARRAASAIDNARLYAEARRALTARDEILGVVAHDLRSPLNAIKLSATLLARKMDTPVTRDAAESILLSTDRASRLIQDLLDIARSESGLFTIVRGEHLAAVLAAQAVQAQEPFAAAAGVELRVDDASESRLYVVADAGRVMQMFENLIGNAIKFTGAGGAIAVGFTSRGDEALFWVRDSGAGIRGEHLAHLFDRFWQGKPSDRRGAGLGLPICRAIAEAHGGRIWAESGPVEGATFYFTLPRAGRQAPAADRRPSTVES